MIADRPLTDIAPLQLADGGTDENGNKVYRTVTQFSMKPIEELGLLKMDFLGLRNLDVIEDALDIIERSTGERPDMARCRSTTSRPTRCSRAATRSACSSSSPRACARRSSASSRRSSTTSSRSWRSTGRAPWTRSPRTRAARRTRSRSRFLDERLRPITESTKGVILYQEQSMQIAKALAGFSGAKADDLRKAIGKKNREAMAKLKPEFFEGCRAPGHVAESVIETLWATNEKAADYSFNKSHAACYALISYRTAWLRANYPAEYMAALISSVMDTKDKVPFFVAQAEQMGIEILPPDVNESDHEFMVVEGNIRFGLDAVKGVGYAAVEAIKAAREEGGPFTSLWDFCERVDAALRQQARDRGADQVRRLRLHRRDPQGHARGARGGAGGRRRRPSSTRRSASRSIFDLAGFGDRGRRGRRSPPRRTRRSRRTSSTARRSSRSRRSRSACSSPSTRSRRCARRCGEGRLRLRRRRGAQGRRLGEDRRHGRGGEEDPHPRRLDDDVRDASTTSRARSRCASSRRRWPRPRARSTRTTSSSSAAGWTTRRPARSA